MTVSGACGWLGAVMQKLLKNDEKNKTDQSMSQQTDGLNYNVLQLMKKVLLKQQFQVSHVIWGVKIWLKDNYFTNTLSSGFCMGAEH